MEIVGEAVFKYEVPFICEYMKTTVWVELLPLDFPMSIPFTQKDTILKVNSIWVFIVKVKWCETVEFHDWESQATLPQRGLGYLVAGKSN